MALAKYLREMGDFTDSSLPYITIEANAPQWATAPIFNNPKPKWDPNQTAEWIDATQALISSREIALVEKRKQIQLGLGKIANKINEAIRAGHEQTVIAYKPDFEYIPLDELKQKCAKHGYTTAFNGMTFTIMW